MATINEIAKELNVSRVRVYQIIAKLPEDLQPNKVNGHYQIENKDVKSIKEYFTKSSLKLKQDNNSENEYKIANKALENEVQTFKEQLTKKDEHIKNLTQLLDQSQRLQLMAENKIKQLESKTTDEQVRKDSSEKTVQTSNVDNTVAKDERGFWSRLFNRKN